MAKYRGREVKLNKPSRGDVKKFKVFVRDKKTGNVKKINFGQKGMSIGRNDQLGGDHLMREWVLC